MSFIMAGQNWRKGSLQKNGCDKGVSVLLGLQAGPFAACWADFVQICFHFPTFHAGESNSLLPQREEGRKGEKGVHQKWMWDRGFCTWGIQTGPFAACWAYFVWNFSNFWLSYWGDELLRCLTLVPAGKRRNLGRPSSLCTSFNIHPTPTERTSERAPPPLHVCQPFPACICADCALSPLWTEGGGPSVLRLSVSFTLLRYRKHAAYACMCKLFWSLTITQPPSLSLKSALPLKFKIV